MNLLIVHLLTRPESPREQRSIAEVTALSEEGGWPCTRLVNQPYDGELPPSRGATDRGFELTSRHYGCWLAHYKALGLLAPVDNHAILICEADCVFAVPIKEMAVRVRAAFGACVENNIPVFTFGYRHDGKTLERIGQDVIVISQLIETHCLLIPGKLKHIVTALFDLKWDAADYVYTVYGYDQRGLRIGTFSDRPVAVQATGESLIDGTIKTSEDHYRNIRYET